MPQSRLLFVDREPLVSVIIPVRNAERTLHKCIESIAKQSYGNWEVIIVDSESSDSTSVIAAEWARSSTNRFVYLNMNRTRTIASARNAGVAASRGQLIFALESDVYPVEVDFLQKCVEIIKRGFDGIVIPVRFEQGESYLGRCFAMISNLSKPEEGFANFIPRSVWLDLGGQDESLVNCYEDLDLALRFKGAGYRQHVVDSCVIHARDLSMRHVLGDWINACVYERIILERWRMPHSVPVLGARLFHSLGLMRRTPAVIPGIAFLAVSRLLVSIIVWLGVTLFDFSAKKVRVLRQDRHAETKKSFPVKPEEDVDVVRSNR